jgi:flagellin
MNATANGLDLHVENYASSLGEFTDAIKGGLDVYIDSASGEWVASDHATAVKLTVETAGDPAVNTLKAGTKTITSVGWNSSDDWVVSDAVVAVAADADAGTAAIQAVDSTLGTVTKAIGTDGLGYQLHYYDANVSDVTAARSAVTSLDDAIDEVNQERSYIGSEQNKLQFTMSNLSNNIQNIEASRSSIEDADFAAEAADLAKNQILAQSATAMLAQAAMISQNLLGLLA